MKEIPNVQLTAAETTVSMLKIALNNTPKDGLDFATMRSRLKVADALDGVESGGVIKLEDADYSAAVEAIKQVRWVVPAKHVIKFAEQFGL